MKSLSILTFLTLLSLSFAAQADLYRWKGPDGKWHLSDTPPPASVKNVKSQAIPTATPVSPAATASGAAPGKSLADQDMEFRKRQQAREEADKKAAQEAAQKQAAAQNCTNARNRLNDLQSGVRMATHNAQGERVIMDDTMRQSAIQEAQKAVSQWCK